MAFINGIEILFSTHLHIGAGGGETTTLGTPTISINGNILIITDGEGRAPTSYEIYVDNDYMGVTTNTICDLSTIISEAGTYSIYVVACVYDLELKSSASNSVSYTKTTSGGAQNYGTKALAIGENISIMAKQGIETPQIISWDCGNNAHIISVVNGETNESVIITGVSAGTTTLKINYTNSDEDYNTQTYTDIYEITVTGGGTGDNTNPSTNRTDAHTVSVEVGNTINLSPAFDSSWDNTGTISANVTEVSNDGVVSIGGFRFGLYFECTGLKAGTAIVKVNGTVTENDGTKHACEITYTITVTGGSAGGGDEEKTHNFTETITVMVGEDKEYRVPTPEGTYNSTVVVHDSIIKTENMDGLGYGIDDSAQIDLILFRAQRSSTIPAYMEISYKTWNYTTGKNELCILKLTINKIDAVGDPNGNFITTYEDTISLVGMGDYKQIYLSNGDTSVLDGSWMIDTGSPTITEISNDGVVVCNGSGDMVDFTALKNGTAIIKIEYHSCIWREDENGEMEYPRGAYGSIYTLTIVVTGFDDSGDDGNDDKYADAANFEQQINITEGSGYCNMVHCDSGDWDTPTIERIEVIENDGCVEIEDTVGSEWVSLSGNWCNCATVKYYCHTYDNHLEEDVYFIVTYTIYVDSAPMGHFYVNFYAAPEPDDGSFERSLIYEFEESMTWEDWVNSSYNNANAWFDEMDYENHLWFGDGSHYISVAKTDHIMPEETYNACFY